MEGAGAYSSHIRTPPIWWGHISSQTPQSHSGVWVWVWVVLDPLDELIRSWAVLKMIRREQLKTLLKYCDGYICYPPPNKKRLIRNNRMSTANQTQTQREYLNVLLELWINIFEQLYTSPVLPAVFSVSSFSILKGDICRTNGAWKLRWSQGRLLLSTSSVTLICIQVREREREEKEEEEEEEEEEEKDEEEGVTKKSVFCLMGGVAWSAVRGAGGRRGCEGGWRPSRNRWVIITVARRQMRGWMCVWAGSLAPLPRRK